jgi:hypothetical protein
MSPVNLAIAQSSAKSIGPSIKGDRCFHHFAPLAIPDAD